MFTRSNCFSAFVLVPRARFSTVLAKQPRRTKVETQRSRHRETGGKVGYDDKKKEIVKVDLNRSQVTECRFGPLESFTELQGSGPLRHDRRRRRPGASEGPDELRFLMLKQTNVTDAGAKKLQQALPDCETISYSPRTRHRPPSSCLSANGASSSPTESSKRARFDGRDNLRG